jgi:hypothetical protein
MNISERQSATIRVASKRDARNQANYFLPILRESPSGSRFKCDDMVGFRQIIGGGESSLYHRYTGWQVIGFRHDPNSSRQGIVVLYKDEQIINISEADVFHTC